MEFVFEINIAEVLMFIFVVYKFACIEECLPSRRTVNNQGH